ncbi:MULTISPECIES: Rap1a/Tai family immunity protein [unclassified Serratia (in: enterobacteria)]|uniref:Rap1a/Tai family immunity protein n=1 Tax=unclassified Serratia (in: enterobacteria) TaxID=2647522 RepID=UPI00068C9A9A|nr:MULTISPECIES: Rap1a/Tai family immunity protein [unclassified Serratia (in: enterobacteria)]
MQKKTYYLTSLATILFFIAAQVPVQAQQTIIQHLTPDNVNLKGEDFFKLYRGTNQQEKEKAQLYLLGVLDATEGKVWCQYSQLQIITLQEFVFEYFKKLPQEQLKLRASDLIEAAMVKDFPCKGGHH